MENKCHETQTLKYITLLYPPHNPKYKYMNQLNTMKINPRQVERAMKRMGIQASQIEAEEVIIKTPEKEIIISNPQVSKVNMMGQDTWQITGDVSERENAPFSDEDIKTVVNQTGASEEEAREVLQQTNGDLAQAILKIKGKK